MYRRLTRVALATFYLATSAGLPQLAEANLWSDRRAAQQRRPAPGVVQLAALPLTALPPVSLKLSAAALSSAEPRFRTAALPFPAPVLEEHATIDDVALRGAPSGPAVLLIRDIHDTPSVQRALSRLFLDLRGAGAADLIALEGAAGPVDAAPFRRSTDPARRAAIADHFLEKSWITGAEHAALLAPAPLPLTGLEDRTLYRANVDAFRASVKAEPAVRSVLSILEAALAKRRAAQPPALRSFDDERRRAATGAVPLAAHLRSLAAVAPFDASEFPQAALFLRTLNAEQGLDLNTVERDRRALVAALAPRLSVPAAASLSAAAAQCRARAISLGDYHARLWAAARAAHVDVSPYRALSGYLAYSADADRLNARALFAETERLEERALTRLARTPEERRFADASAFVSLLEKLADHAMTPWDWTRFAARRSALDGLPADLGAPIDGQPLSRLFASHIAFCERAIDRNAAFLRAIDGAIASGARRIVVVAGGFHADGLAEGLRASGRSVVMVTPKADRLSSPTAYLDYFVREPQPVERLFEGERVFLAPPVALGGARTTRGAIVRGEFPLLDAGLETAAALSRGTDPAAATSAAAASARQIAADVGVTLGTRHANATMGGADLAFTETIGGHPVAFDVSVTRASNAPAESSRDAVDTLNSNAAGQSFAISIRTPAAATDERGGRRWRAADLLAPFDGFDSWRHGAWTRALAYYAAVSVVEELVFRYGAFKFAAALSGSPAPSLGVLAGVIAFMIVGFTAAHVIIRWMELSPTVFEAPGPARRPFEEPYWNGWRTELREAFRIAADDRSTWGTPFVAGTIFSTVFFLGLQSHWPVIAWAASSAVHLIWDLAGERRARRRLAESVPAEEFNDEADTLVLPESASARADVPRRGLDTGSREDALVELSDALTLLERGRYVDVMLRSGESIGGRFLSAAFTSENAWVLLETGPAGRTTQTLVDLSEALSMGFAPSDIDAGQRETNLEEGLILSPSLPLRFDRVPGASVTAVRHFAVDPRGRWIAIDYLLGLQVRRADTGAVRHNLSIADDILAMDWLSDGRLLIALKNGRVVAWTVDQADTVVDRPGTVPLTAMAVDGTRTRYAVADESGALEFRSARTRTVLWTAAPGEHGAIQSLAISDDGTRLAAAHADGWIEVRDLANGQLLLAFSAGPQAGRIAINSDASLLAVAAGTSILLIDPRTGATLRNLASVNATSLAFAADGRLLVGTANGSVGVIDPATGDAHFVGTHDTDALVGPVENARVLFSSGGDGSIVQWHLRATPPHSAPLFAGGITADQYLALATTRPGGRSPVDDSALLNAIAARPDPSLSAALLQVLRDPSRTDGFFYLSLFALEERLRRYPGEFRASSDHPAIAKDVRDTMAALSQLLTASRVPYSTPQAAAIARIMARVGRLSMFITDLTADHRRLRSDDKSEADALESILIRAAMELEDGDFVPAVFQIARLGLDPLSFDDLVAGCVQKARESEVIVGDFFDRGLDDIQAAPAQERSAQLFADVFRSFLQFTPDYPGQKGIAAGLTDLIVRTVGAARADSPSVDAFEGFFALIRMVLTAHYPLSTRQSEMMDDALEASAQAYLNHTDTLILQKPTPTGTFAEPDPAVLIDLMKALAARGRTDPFRQLLLVNLADPDISDVFTNAVIAEIKSGEFQNMPIESELINVLESRNTAFGAAIGRRNAYRVLAEFQTAKVRTFLVDRFHQEDDPSVRTSVAAGLEGRFANAMDLLNTVFGEAHPGWTEERATTARASLSRLEADGMLPELRAMSSDTFSESIFVDPAAFDELFDSLTLVRTKIGAAALDRRIRQWHSLKDVEILIYTRSGTVTSTLAGYTLAFPLPAAQSALAPEDARLVTARRALAREQDRTAARAAYAHFRSIIEANFAALELIGAAGTSLTRDEAEQVLELVAKMVDGYEALFPDELAPSFSQAPRFSSGHRVWVRFTALRRDLEAEWANLRPDDVLPDALRRRVSEMEPNLASSLDVDHIDNIHTLINFIHRGSFDARRNAMTGLGGDTLLEVAGGEVTIVDLGDRPAVAGGRIQNRGVRLILDGLERTGHRPHMTLFVNGNDLSAHANLGAHVAELDGNLTSVNEGYVRLRYSEWGNSISNKLRLAFVAAVLRDAGLHVEITGDRFLTAILDKDHGATSVRALESCLWLVTRVLHHTAGIDYSLGYAAESEGYDAVVQTAQELARIFVAEGRLPFYTANIDDDRDTSLIEGLNEYLQSRRPLHAGVRVTLNHRLDELHLPRIPEDIELGQAVVDRYYSRPIRVGLARGQFRLDTHGVPSLDPSYRPSRSILNAITADEAETARAGEILDLAETEAFDWEEVGAIGRLSMSIGQIEREKNQWLVIVRLTDPATGRTLYATAYRADETAIRVPITADELEAALRDEDLLTAAPLNADLTPLLPSEQRLALLRAAPIPAADPGLSVSALAASAGDGRPVIGPLTFERNHAADHRGLPAIFGARFTTPDDLEAIRTAGAVVTTGGGILSHAGITTREYGIPSVIDPNAEVVEIEGRKFLKATASTLAPAVKEGDVWVSPGVERQTVFVAEGDLMMLNGAKGRLSFFLSASQSALREALRALGVFQATGRDADAAFTAGPAYLKVAQTRLGLRELRPVDPSWNVRNIEASDWRSGYLADWRRYLQETSEHQFAYDTKAVSTANGPVLTLDQFRLLKSFHQDADPADALVRRLAALVAPARPGASEDEVSASATQARDVVQLLLFEAVNRPGLSRVVRDAVIEALARLADRKPGVPVNRAVGGAFTSFRARIPGATIADLEDRIAAASTDIDEAGSSDRVRTLLFALRNELAHAASVMRLLGQTSRLSDLTAKVEALGTRADQRTAGMKAKAAAAIELTAKDPMPDWHALPDLRRQLREATQDGITGPAREELARWVETLTQQKDALVANTQSAAYPLGEVDGDYSNLIGGKAAKEGEITGIVRDLDAFVPTGVALSRIAFDMFLDENDERTPGYRQRYHDLAAELDRVLGEQPSDRRDAEIERLSDEIRRHLDQGALADEETAKGPSLGHTILRYIDDHGLGDKFVAVRSSGLQEDTEGAAFAGAAETFLYVDRANILPRIKDSWKSFWIPRGILYRHENNFTQAAMRPATLIQEMVASEKSGVAFSVNPVTGDDEVIVNAAYGLGEGVVSGSIQSDQYALRKSDGSLRRLPVIGSKRTKVVRRTDATGTMTELVDDADRKRPALTAEERRQVTRITVALERHFGYPIDLEFAIVNGRVAVLQVRPITATGTGRHSRHARSSLAADLLEPFVLASAWARRLLSHAPARAVYYAGVGAWETAFQVVALHFDMPITMGLVLWALHPVLRWMARGRTHGLSLAQLVVEFRNELGFAWSSPLRSRPAAILAFNAAFFGLPVLGIADVGLRWAIVALVHAAYDWTVSPFDPAARPAQDAIDDTLLPALVRATDVIEAERPLSVPHFDPAATLATARAGLLFGEADVAGERDRAALLSPSSEPGFTGLARTLPFDTLGEVRGALDALNDAVRQSERAGDDPIRRANNRGYAVGFAAAVLGRLWKMNAGPAVRAALSTLAGAMRRTPSVARAAAIVAFTDGFEDAFRHAASADLAATTAAAGPAAGAIDGEGAPGTPLLPLVHVPGHWSPAAQDRAMAAALRALAPLGSRISGIVFVGTPAGLARWRSLLSATDDGRRLSALTRFASDHAAGVASPDGTRFFVDGALNPVAPGDRARVAAGTLAVPVLSPLAGEWTVASAPAFSSADIRLVQILGDQLMPVGRLGVSAFRLARERRAAA